MINTNKKIHIYNRLRTIYTSKNRYYIRHNKKYIDIYTIIKKANRQRGGGAKKNQEGFLSEELIEIKIPSREQLLCTSINYSKVHAYIVDRSIYGFDFGFYRSNICYYIFFCCFKCCILSGHNSRYSYIHIIHVCGYITKL